MRRTAIIFVALLAFSEWCSAQIQVSQEPMHHKVFENDWVRILDVHVPPGDTSLFHMHSTPSVFLILSKTKTGSEVLVEPAKISLSDGNIWFEGFYEKPRIHRVWNEDTVEFHVIDMELPFAGSTPHIGSFATVSNAGTSTGSGSTSNAGSSSRSGTTAASVPAVILPPIVRPGFKILFDEKPIRGYRYTLEAGKSFRLKDRKTPVVIIGLSETNGKTLVNGNVFQHKGNYLFLLPGKDIEFVNQDSTPVEFGVFELK